MSESLTPALWVIGAYLLGSVSFGDLIARMTGREIRSVGTGNPGTANTFRELGARHALAVFVLDLAKGAAATAPLYLLGTPSWVGLAATAAVLAGHFFPVFWRFRGGTGLVVGIGAVAGLLPLGALIAAPFTVATARLTRNMGYAGVVFFAAAIVAGWLVQGAHVGVAATLMAGVAVYVKSQVQYGHWRLGRAAGSVGSD